MARWEDDPLVDNEQQSAASGGKWQDDPLAEQSQPNMQQRYDEALEAVRLQKFSDVPAEKFAKFAERTYAPYGPGELADHSISMGLLDEINASGSAAVSGLEKLLTGNGPGFGEAYTANKELEEARRELGREQSGKLGAAAEIGGGLVSVGPGKALQAGGAAIKQGQKFLPRLAQSFKTALPSAGVAGLYGAGATDGGFEDRGIGAAVGTVLGAGIGTSAPYAIAGIQKVANATMRTLQRVPVVGKAAELLNAQARYQGSLEKAIKQAPAAQAIKRQSSAIFDEISASDSVLTPQAIRDLTVRVGKTMQGAHMKPRFDKGAQSILDELTDLSQGPAHISELHTVREQAQALMSNGESVGRDDFFLQTVVRQIDGFFGKLKPSDLVGKSGNEKGNEVLRGISLWGRYKRTQTLERVIEKAGRAKGGFATGLRSQFVKILDSKAKSRGFHAEDLAAMQKFVDGGQLNSALEKLGSARGVMGAAAGGVATGPVGLVGLPVAGAMAKGALNQSARTTANALRAQIASGGTLPKMLQPSKLPSIAGRLGARAGAPMVERHRMLLEN